MSKCWCFNLEEAKKTPDIHLISSPIKSYTYKAEDRKSIIMQARGKKSIETIIYSQILSNFILEVITPMPNKV